MPGLFTSEFPGLEDLDEIKKRIKKQANIFPLENLALSPQCGFPSSEEGNILTEEEPWNKIKHVIKIADSVWDKVPTNKCKSRLASFFLGYIATNTVCGKYV